MSSASSQLSAEAVANLPRHVAVIMDGNGRGAKSRHLPRIEGHRRGADAAREIIRTAGELIAAAKKDPGKLNFGSPGNGTTGHLGMELFQHAAKVKLTVLPRDRVKEGNVVVIGPVADMADLIAAGA